MRHTLDNDFCCIYETEYPKSVKINLRKWRLQEKDLYEVVENLDHLQSDIRQFIYDRFPVYLAGRVEWTLR